MARLRALGLAVAGLLSLLTLSVWLSAQHSSPDLLVSSAPAELLSEDDKKWAESVVLREAEAKEDTARSALRDELAKADQEVKATPEDLRFKAKRSSHASASAVHQANFEAGLLESEDELIQDLRQRVHKQALGVKEATEAADESERIAKSDALAAKKLAQREIQQKSFYNQAVEALSAATLKALAFARGQHPTEANLDRLTALQHTLKQEETMKLFARSKGKYKRNRSSRHPGKQGGLSSRQVQRNSRLQRQRRLKRMTAQTTKRVKRTLKNKWKTVPLKKSQCVPPYAWVKGTCRVAPYSDKTPPMCRGSTYTAVPGMTAAQVRKKCLRWKKMEKKKMKTYDKALRTESGYRYTKDYAPRTVGQRIRNNHFRTPQRFPHRDRVDLGDNYISGFSDSGHGSWPRNQQDDRVVVSADRLYGKQSPPGWGSFFGKGHRVHRHLFASNHMSPWEVKQLLRYPRLRRFLHRNDRMGNHSPLERRIKNIVFGRAHRYWRNKYGWIGSDRFPSRRQIYNQLEPKYRGWRHRAHYGRQPRSVLRTKWPRYRADRTEVFPARTIYVQRWRRRCWRHHAGKRKCGWRPVLEPRWEKCDKKDCRTKDPNKEKYSKYKRIRVCDKGHPNDCYKQRGYTKPHDPIEEQIMYGSQNGKADPLGFKSELEDDHEPANQVVADKLEGSYLEKEGGEPIGDFIVRNWQGHNGIDHFDHQHFGDD